MSKSARIKAQEKWYHQKGESLRQDIVDALTELKTSVENQGTPRISLTTLNTYRQRELTVVRTVRVQEWEFGYKVAPLDFREGFFKRTLFVKLRGGRLSEINKRERRQIIDAIATAVMDVGSGMDMEPISECAFALHQPFAVAFWNENSPDVVTPSARLINASFDPAQIKEDGK